MILSLDSISIFVPKSFKDTFNNLRWSKSILDEIHDLKETNTWDLVDLPSGKKEVESKWVVTVKVNSDGSLAILKATLVTKWYA